MSSKLHRSAVRLAALASVSLLALPGLAQAANDQTAAAKPQALLGLGGAPAPAAKPVQPFYGNLRPFYGNLRPFYGNLRPFYGNLRPFWGNLRPFWGDTGAFYGDLKAFWGVSNPVVGASPVDYTKVADFWTKSGDDWAVAFTALTAGAPNYQTASAKLETIYGDSARFWGAAVQAKTGKSFEDGFLKPFLAAHGIDPNNTASYSNLDQSELAYLFLEYYDGLMDYTGTDHVDHWMKTVNWNPALTVTQSGGGDKGPVIGLLDQTVVGEQSLEKSIVRADGISTFTNGHGAAVASLIVGAQDGKGVMGIAPHSQVVAYNPFDSSGTANWADITTGVQRLKAEGAGVVNMSLGVPGVTFDQGWNDVFSALGTTLILKNTVFVMAAGNEGVTQSKNIAWNLLNPAFIVVGSVDVEGNISNFSNRPGDACLTRLLGLCTGDKLKDHFIVAPGELILVDDGHGGVTRQIGTSFAAPLVSGAIALLHDRWPWLVNFPKETADIILKSAKDLGAPGTDDVYGRGLLDVTASQSPLDFNNLIWFSVKNGVPVPQTAKMVLTTYQGESQKSWDAKGAYFYAFEPLSLLASRDFAIPLSSKLIGQNVTSLNGAHEQFQAYLLSRMDTWAASQPRSLAFGGRGFNGFTSGSYPVANPWGANLTVSFSPRVKAQGYRDEGPDYQSSLTLATEGSSMLVGFGDGAVALNGLQGLGLGADYDSARGGANPLLGLASGGMYANWTVNLTQRLQVSAGTLERSARRDANLLPALGYAGNGAETYEAAAQHISLKYRLADGLTLVGGYTHLSEATGLLGVQSFDPQDFRHGSTTDGYSVGVNWTLAHDVTLAASGTMGRTRAGASQTLSVEKGGLTTSAYEVAVSKNNLFAKGDSMRLTLSQPMYVERGRLNLQTVQVVDRQTGEIGIVNQGFDIAGKRPFAAEVVYGRPVEGGAGDISLVGRAETLPSSQAGTSYMAGARYRVAF